MASRTRKLILTAAGVTAGLVAANVLRRPRDGARSCVAAITIDRAPHVVFSSLQDATVAKQALNGTGDASVDILVERDAEIVSWGSAASGRVVVAIRTAPGQRGTELHATAHGGSQDDVKAILRRFKQLVEAGELATGERSR